MTSDRQKVVQLVKNLLNKLDFSANELILSVHVRVASRYLESLFMSAKTRQERIEIMGLYALLGRKMNERI